MSLDVLIAALRDHLRDIEFSKAQDRAATIQGHITGAVKNWHGDTPGIGRAAIAVSTLVSYLFQTTIELAIIQINHIASANVRHGSRSIHQPLARRRVRAHPWRAKEGRIIIRLLEQGGSVTGARIRWVSRAVADGEGERWLLDAGTAQVRRRIHIDSRGAGFRGAKKIPNP